LKKLKSEINKYFESLRDPGLDEVRSKQKGIYRFFCMIRYSDTDRSLEDILTDVRALPSITIVKTEGDTNKIGPGEYVAAMSIKYVPSPVGVPSSPEKRKTEIISNLRRISGIKKVFKVSSRVERFDA